MRGELWIHYSLLLLSSLSFLLAIEQSIIAADKDVSEVEHRVKRESETHLKSEYEGYGGVPSIPPYSSFPGFYPGSFPGSYPASFPGFYPGSFPGSYPGSFPGSYPGSFPGSYPGSFPGSYPNSFGNPSSLYPIVVPVPYVPPSPGRPDPKPCDCTPKPLPPCTVKNEKPNKTPAEGGPMCQCNPDHHPQGCTPKLCESGILPNLLPLYVCICLGVNPANDPPNCIKILSTGPAGPQTAGASTSGVGHTNVLGLAELTGIKTDAKDQLGAGLAGANLLSDQRNSKLYVDLLNDVVGGKTQGLGGLKTTADSLLSKLGGGAKSSSLLGLTKRKKRAAGHGQMQNFENPKGLQTKADSKILDSTKAKRGLQEKQQKPFTLDDQLKLHNKMEAERNQ